MSALSVFVPGLAMGLVVSIPPGPAGVIILHRALRDEKQQAVRALAAFLVAELVAVGVTFGFLGSLAGLAALPGMKPAAGLYLLAFAVSAWRAAAAERGFPETSAFAVFRITILNPAIWLGAVSMLTIAGARGGPGFLPRVVFVAGAELGSMAWYLAVIAGARRVPSAYRRYVERAAVLVIGAIGAWFVASIFLPR